MSHAIRPKLGRRCALRLELFTLIELLVVVAVIMILMALLMPGLQKSRQVAMRAKCMGNERQILTAIFCYANDWNDWLPVGQGVHSGGDSTDYWLLTRILVSNGYLPYSSSGTLTAGARTGVLICPAEQEPPIKYGEYSFNQRLFGHTSGGDMHRSSGVRKPSSTMALVDSDATVADYYTSTPIFTYRIDVSVGYYRHAGFVATGYVDMHVAGRSKADFSTGIETYDTLRWRYPEKDP